MEEKRVCYSRRCKERDLQAERCLIYLKWSDASYQENEVLYLEDIKPEVLIETAGFLVRETETHYTVALDHYSGNETWRHVASIPKGMVQRELRFPWPEAGGI